MSDDLYHQRLVALARAADGAGNLPPPALSGEADNPLCGDRVRMTLRLEDGRIAALAHKTRGCLLCEAAAAAIGRRAPGNSTDDIHLIAARLRDWLKNGTDLPTGTWPEFADFAPVRAVKSRHDCVLLPFRALIEALKEIDPR
ncbi:MAG: iron-sulfur cluster assembly scaffold protein [Rhodospirillaceae bacterium]|nr:iron-sulfur cluster assembly scaffold protein [Rhodospirillaceae bacterium]